MLEVPFEGGCQCGAIRYRCTASPVVAYLCHCRECQRMTSSAFASCIQVPAEAFSVTAGSLSTRDRRAQSGNLITSSFCGRCGSTLCSSNASRGHRRTLYIGTLDRPGDVDVRAHIWTKSRLPWVVLPREHDAFPEAADWNREASADSSRREP